MVFFFFFNPSVWCMSEFQECLLVMLFVTFHLCLPFIFFLCFLKNISGIFCNCEYASNDIMTSRKSSPPYLNNFNLWSPRLKKKEACFIAIKYIGFIIDNPGFKFEVITQFCIILSLMRTNAGDLPSWDLCIYLSGLSNKLLSYFIYPCTGLWHNFLKCIEV